MIETQKVRQNPDEPFRRWFADEDLDLIVWYEPDGPVYGFELSFDKINDQRVFRWFKDKALTLHRVNAGEEIPFGNASDRLEEIHEKVEMGELLSLYDAAKAGLPPDLAALVRSKLTEYAHAGSAQP